MKKVFFSLFFSICVMFYGCTCYECCGVECENGTCDATSGEAGCLCNDGFEKDSSGQCTIESRTKFLQPNLAPAIYQGIDSCLSGTAASLTISAVTNSITSLELSGLTFMSKPVPVVISRLEGNTFEHPGGLTLNNGISLYELKGTISQNKLTMIYTLTGNNSIKTCIFIGNK